MDWINSALTDSDEDEEYKTSKINIKNKTNNNLEKFVQETTPFPKILQSTETIIETYKTYPKNQEITSKKLKEYEFSNKEGDSDIKNREKHESDPDLVEDKPVTLDKKPENEFNGSKKLFSIETKTRKIEKFDQVKIKSQELNEAELRELSQLTPSSSSNLDSKPSFQVQKSPEHPGAEEVLGEVSEEYEEKLDYNEALDSFNKSNVNFDKLLKSNQWLGPKVKIKDIRAEDLYQSEIEKDRNYTCNREILYEGSKRFSMPTRLMETEDGQVITTNVARRTQKRKHQINWLAMEAQDKEMEIMEKTAHMRKSKRETQMKYGW